MNPATLESVYQHISRAVAEPDVKVVRQRRIRGDGPAAGRDGARRARARSALGRIIRQLGVTLD